MKIFLVLVISFLTVIPAYGNDNIMNEDQKLGVVGGEIWNRRNIFNIQEVNVNGGKIEVIIESMSPEKEIEIRKIAYPYEVEFINTENQGKDNYIKTKEFILTEGETYVKCEGMFFEIQDAPYISSGFLMIPLRQVFTMLDDSSEINYEINWMGGNDESIELLTGSGLPIQISSKNNTLTILPDNTTFSLDGKIEIHDGIAFYPCSKDNLRFIFPVVNIQQDFEEISVKIMS